MSEPEPATAPRRPSSALERWLPLVGWIARSDRRSRRADLVAGLTVAAMLVPQGMAYATLAGLPPVAGLYAATVPLVVYALLGTSGQLAFGPVAIVSLLTASTLAPLADGDAASYAGLAALLALLVGAVQLLLGVLRIGRLTSMLSHPVVSGFTSAAAIVIATSQLPTLLGVDVSGTDRWATRIVAIVRAVPDAHLPTVLAGMAAIGVLVAGRRWVRRLPTALVLVVVATSVVALFDLDVLATIGTVPAGLPAPTLPLAPVAAVTALLPGAVVIALLSYLEGISVARAVATRTRDRIDPDQELIASGAANLAAGLFQGYPVAGGFSRTAVAHTAGARSPLTGLVAAGGVVLVLVSLAPLLATLPRVVLAAIVVVAVASLVDVHEAVHVSRIEPTDGLALGTTFLATLLLGIELGIAVGIGVSFLLLLWRVGGLRLTAEHVPGVDLLAVDGDLLPASGVRLRDAVDDHLATAPAPHLVLDLTAVPTADASGVQALLAVDDACHAAGVTLHLAAARIGVTGPLRRGGLLERFADRMHLDPRSAMACLAPGATAPCRPDGASERDGATAPVVPAGEPPPSAGVPAAAASVQAAEDGTASRP